MDDKKVNLEEGEEIVTSVNDHWIILLRPAVVHSLGFLFGALLIAISISLQDDYPRIQLILFIMGWVLTLFIFNLMFAYLFSWELS